VRGLRLASTDLGASETPAVPAAAESADPPPPDPTAPTGGRPALKRIK
jgi:hypothetical protein